MRTAPDEIAVVFGTRPELIKLADVVRGLAPRARTIHTGQHYSPALAGDFLAELELGKPAVQLEVGGRSRAGQISQALEQLDGYLEASRPAAVVVQGDTNTSLAGALAANARSVPLVHVEAGLRSWDRAMPEEHNRVVVDHLADLCLAPTPVNRGNLLAEGVASERIIVTGNPVIDAARSLLPGASYRQARLGEVGVEPGRYVLATFHRPENVDDPDRLALVLDELAQLSVPVVLPLHPRTADRARAFGLDDRLRRLVVIDPVGYRDFLSIFAESACAVSDSGGVVEEATVVKRPVVVVRNSTERPEALESFAVLVQPGPAIGATVDTWLDDLTAMHARLATLPSPFGDGHAAERCVRSILQFLAT